MSKKTEQKDANLLKEVKMSWAGKLFFAGVASYLAGKAYKALNKEQVGEEDTEDSGGVPRIPIKVKGTKEQIDALTKTIMASKEFQEEIQKPGATIEGVMEKLKARNLAKKEFEEKTGKPWPI